MCGYACSPGKGSEEGISWSWATGLAKLGFDVWCVSNVAYKKEVLEAHRKLNYPNLHFVFVSLLPALDKFLLNPSSKKIYFHYALWKHKASKIAKKLHRDVGFDIGHHVSFGSLQQGHFLWKLRGIKIIFGPVGGGQKAPAIFREYFGRAWKTEKVRDFITKLSVNYSRNFRNSLTYTDWLLANNQETISLAIRSGYISGNKTQLIKGTAAPFAMGNMPRADMVNQGTIKLIWVGRLLPRKGMNLVLEALSKLPSDFDFSFTIVGGGKLFSKLNDWISQYGIDKEKIHITGSIPFGEVKKYYQNSHVFIFCPLRETFGTQLSEAMAFGLPVITLNIHGASVGVPDNCGIKITPDTREQTLKDISDAVIKMKNDKTFLRSCSDNAYSYSKENKWDETINDVVEKFY